MSITLISCIDMDNGIGDAEGNLLFNLPRDMKHFKSITSGKIVVMGRKTWDSLPKKPLPKRKNYVLTMDETFNPDGAKTLHHIDEVLELGKKHDVYIIGGGELYHQTIDFADKMILTQVHKVNSDARVHFPDFSPEHWALKTMVKNEQDDKHEASFVFATYERIKN